MVADLRAGKPLPEDFGGHPATAMFSRIDRAGVEYLVEVDAVNPARAPGEIQVPVVIVQGGRDASVGEDHARQLAAARHSRRTEMAFFPELQHFYKSVEEGTDPMVAFALDTDSDPAVGEAIDRFIHSTVK